MGSPGLTTGLSSQRVEFPPLTKQNQWALRSTAPWSQFISRPNRQFLPTFTLWIYGRLVSSDVPSLYQAMQLAWLSVCPPGAKGPNTDQLQGLVYTLLHFGLAACRIRVAYHRQKWPCWFKNVWKVLPETFRIAIPEANPTWFKSATDQIGTVTQGAYVYLMFSHGGTYIGKTNATRRSRTRGDHLGIVARTLEHSSGLLFPQTASGKLPRYKVARASVGSFGVLPLQLLGGGSASSCLRKGTHPECQASLQWS